MQMTTDRALTAIIAADSTIRERDAAAAMAILRGTADAPAAPDAIMTRKEVAEILRITPHCVSDLVRAGKLRRVRLGGRERAHGYSRNSVYALLEARDGEAAA